jgi:hypothetical protein
MSKFSILLSTILVLLASGTGAQTMPYPQVDTAPVAAVVVTAAANTVRITDDQARQIAGIYAMSNGWKLKVLPSSRSIDAMIDRQKPIRLLAVSADKFVSGDGRVSMEFNRGNSGKEMMMSYVPDSGLADVVVISSSIAQR